MKRFCGIRLKDHEHTQIITFFRQSTFENQSEFFRTAVLAYVHNGHTKRPSPQSQHATLPQDLKWLLKDFNEYKDRVLRLEDQIALLL